MSNNEQTPLVAQWVEAATRLNVEAARLVLQAKKVERAHGANCAVARKCLEAFDETIHEKYAANPLRVMMAAFGAMGAMGTETPKDMADALWRDAVGSLRVSQVIDLLTSLPGLSDPASQEEKVEAMRLAIRQKHGTNVASILQSDMTEMAHDDRNNQKCQEEEDDEWPDFCG
jgi:hypothetical protein